MPKSMLLAEAPHESPPVLAYLLQRDESDLRWVSGSDLQSASQGEIARSRELSQGHTIRGINQHKRDGGVVGEAAPERVSSKIRQIEGEAAVTFHFGVC
jgi:hypothetical protein